MTESGLNPNDVRLSGDAPKPGGQHTGRVSTAITATHLPTGLSARCDDQPSQLRNRDEALRRLSGLVAASALPGVREPAEPTLDIAAIRARCEKATPGPWRASWSDGAYGTPIHAPIGSTGRDYGPHIANAFHDAEFIAHARTDIPALLAALSTAHATAERYQQALEETRAVANDLWASGTLAGKLFSARLRNAMALASSLPAPLPAPEAT